MSNLEDIKPVYYIDEEDKKIISDIENLLHKLKIDDDKKKKSLKIKSEVRSIHSSLSIEANSLSLNDVSDIYENKFVLGSKKEIQEVKNAIELYEHIKEFDWKKENDLIKAHMILMKYFDDDNNRYRNHGEGIKRGNKIVFVAPNSIIVKPLMESLFKFLNDSNIHPLVLASIFHYYFVYIHPFTDGNGRLARFWVSLILVDYDSLFEYIPIEEELYLNQEEYYNSIEKCHNNSNCNVFIKFMLKSIYDSIIKLSVLTEDISLNKTEREILKLIKDNSKITQQEIADKMKLNIRTIKRNFKKLIDTGYIVRVGSDKSGYWKYLK